MRLFDDYFADYWFATDYWPLIPAVISIVPDIHQPGIGPRGIGKSGPHADRKTEYVRHPMRNTNYIRKSR